MTDKRLVLSTVASNEEARVIAGALVEKGLAACVNILGPIQSIYRWKAAVKSKRRRRVSQKVRERTTRE